MSLRYDLDGNHPLVGRSVPNFELAIVTRADEFLRAGKGPLLDFDGNEALRTAANERPDCGCRQ
jgi:hypothetical protein